MNTTQLLVTNGSGEQHLQAALTNLHSENDWQNATLPDADITVLNEDGEGIKIAQVRQVISDSSFKPYARAQRAVLILNLEQASLPAQQALLKFFEEPPEYLRIITTTSQINSILPTIQSRCQITHLAQTDTTSIPDEVNTWIQNLSTASYADIIALSASYKDKEAAFDFLQNCVKGLTTTDTYPSELSVFATQKILTTSTKIQANANTRLSIEDCFFSIKTRF